MSSYGNIHLRENKCSLHEKKASKDNWGKRSTKPAKQFLYMKRIFCLLQC